jgi:predicted dehydrogenase
MAVRTAVIGAGKVARTHAAVLASLDSSDFVAVCSRTPEKASALADEFGALAFTDIPTMIRDAGVEAVVICTPHPAHAGPAVAALENGAHVLVEKPLAASLADCDAMISAAKRAGRSLGVVSQRRWITSALRVKTAIDEGRIGLPILATAALLGWRSPAYYESDAWRGRWETEGGGVLVNQAPHQLDLLLWYMGEIAEVSGYWANLNHPQIEVEDTAVAIVRFASGALGSIVLSNSQNPGLYGRVHVHGSSGATIGVQTDGGSMFIAGMTPTLEPPFNDVWTVPEESALLAGWQQEEADRFQRIDPIQHYFALQTADFLDCIRSGRPPLVTGEDGRRVVELFTAIYESQRTSAPVKLPLAPV